MINSFSCHEKKKCFTLIREMPSFYKKTFFMLAILNLFLLASLAIKLKHKPWPTIENQKPLKKPSQNESPEKKETNTIKNSAPSKNHYLLTHSDLGDIKLIGLIMNNKLSLCLLSSNNQVVIGKVGDFISNQKEKIIQIRKQRVMTESKGGGVILTMSN